MSMVRELLQLLLAFTAHPDLGGVALLTLELWVYLPEMLGLLQEPTSAAAAVLVEVQPALVEVLARQCRGSPKWTAKEWRLGLGGRRGRQQQGGLGGGGGDGEEEEEEEWARFADALSFRSEAMDAAEAMASTWPEVRCVVWVGGWVGVLFDHFSVELCWRGVHRGHDTTRQKRD
jgi:hypothetical protein